MNRTLAAQIAIGAVGTMAAHRFAKPPALAALATIVASGSSYYARRQPDAAILVATAVGLVLLLSSVEGS